MDKKPSLDIKSGKTFQMKPTLNSKEVIKSDQKADPKKSDQVVKKPNKIIQFFKDNRWAQIVGIIVAVLLLIGIGFGIYWLITKDKGVTFQEQLKMAKDQPKEMARRLDGVIVPTADANKYPVAVMIENLVDVRPQHALSQAQVVYETVVEGNITRFMALYAGNQADEIHPVRSARPYYLQWASEYDALYAHCGGSQEALDAILSFGIKDLDQIGAGAPYFWRGEGEAPHNLFASTKTLNLALRDRKLDTVKPKYDSWKFKDEIRKENRPTTIQDIKINFAGDYSVEYKYDPETNTYLRFNPIGVEHKDAVNDSQIAPKNVVIQYVPKEQVMDDYGRLQLVVTGEGKVQVFRDGEMVEGAWKKNSRTDRTKFYDSTGSEIKLNRGQTWITVVPDGFSVEVL
ncbi:MAG: DUF3048 domain-containing protein [Patescibacteria group bacterium]|jgi:hypothetical protein